MGKSKGTWASKHVLSNSCRLRPHALSGCIYCGQGPLSAEHWHGQWFEKFYKLDNNAGPFEASLTMLGGNNFQSEVDLIIRDARNRKKMYVACVSCNAGWMAGLQNKMKCIAEDLFSYRWALTNPESLSSVAAWTAMTIMTHEFTGGRISPQSDRDYLEENKKCPENWYILFGWYDGTGHMSISHLYGDSYCKENPTPIKYATLVFGTVLLVAIRFDIASSKNENFILDAYARFGLFPVNFATGGQKRIPSRWHDDASANEIAKALHPSGCWYSIRSLNRFDPSGFRIGF